MGYRLPIFGESSSNIYTNSEYDTADARGAGFTPNTAASSKMATSVLKSVSAVCNEIVKYLKYSGSSYPAPGNVIGPQTSFSDDFGLRLVTPRGQGTIGFSEITQGQRFLRFTIKKGHYYKIFVFFGGDIRPHSSGTAQKTRSYAFILNGTTYYSKTLYSSTQGGGAFENMSVLETFAFGSGSYGGLGEAFIYTDFNTDHEYAGGGSGVIDTNVVYKRSSFILGTNIIELSHNYNYVGSGSNYDSCGAYYGYISSDPDFTISVTAQNG